MHKKMGVITVLTVFIVATCAVTFTDNSEAAGDYTYIGTTYDATKVTSFTFPESQGIPVMTTLSTATTEIDISIYFISSKNVLALLCDMMDDNPSLKVNILIDGTPLGVSSDLPMLRKMDDMGADVKLINPKGVSSSDCEYDYLHNKYAIIDNKTVIITSENWTQTNFSNNTSNRGWGAIIDSVGYATYMKGIFNNDFDESRADVKNIEDPSLGITAATTEYTYTIPSGTIPTKTVTNVKVSAVHSPQNSGSKMKQFMDAATSRLYVEELDIDKNFADMNGNTPIGWMVDAAERGVDVRYVLDISYEKAKNPEHSQLIYDLNHNSDVKAAPIKGGHKFTVTHNKGLISDNMVWVGSVNMTKNSFEDDRESAVIIYSKDLADWYGGYFEQDFKYDPEYKPGEYTIVDQIIEETPWYVPVLAVLVVAVAIFFKATAKGAVKGGKKGAQKAAVRSAKSGAKKVANSVIKEATKSSTKKSTSTKKKK